MNEIASAVSAALAARGWRVDEVDVDPLSSRLVGTDELGEECEIDILREAFSGPPVATEYGLVLALDDVIGTKVRALADRGAARDLIDLHAVSDIRSFLELEDLGRRHARDDFRLDDLALRLGGADWYEDEAFTVYGIGDEQVAAIRAWATAWAEDIGGRQAMEEFDSG